MTDRKDTMSEQSNHALPAHIQMALDGWVAEYKELLAFRETAQGTIEELQRQVAEADAARRHAQAVGSDLVAEKRELLALLKLIDAHFDTMMGDGSGMPFQTFLTQTALLRGRVKGALEGEEVSKSVPQEFRAAEIDTPSETIASVTTWANETFGQATIWNQIMRAKKEFQELIAADLKDGNKIAEEAADVCICLYRVIGTLDPEAINKKMKKNRARKWALDGNGCAQHVVE